MAATIERFCNGQSVGVGSLPHRDPAAAAAFSIAEFDVATVPSLPNRSPAEAMVAQAGATDMGDDGFVGMRAFLDLASMVGVDGAPVKWQFVGPVTVGIDLQRSGLSSAEAFAQAIDVVCRHVAAISATISATLPASPQLMLLDEPSLVELMSSDFPLSPDAAIDLISTAMAAVPADVAVGLHCCGPCDIATMLETGPHVVSVPVSDELIDYAGYLARFIDRGGVVAWGALPTVGPLPTKPDRFWRELSELWCTLVQHGVDASLLRQRSLVTPQCGLAGHHVSTARRVARLTAAIGRKVNAQAISTKLAFGA